MTELRTPPRHVLPPDLGDEEEVDLRRYWQTVAARWWLLVLGILAGILIGYLVALGSGSVWRATAVLYLGNPLSLGGGSVQGLQQNPRTVNEIVHSERAIEAVAARCDIRPGDIRGGTSARQVSEVGRGAVARAGAGQLMQITAQSNGPRKAECAAERLAERIVARIGHYPDAKIKGYQAELDALESAIRSNRARIAVLTRAVSTAGGEVTLEDVFLVSQLDNAEQRRAELVAEQAEKQQLLALAENFEKPQVVENAAAVKALGRSPRNSMLIGAVLGLLVGLVAALVWDPASRRLRSG